MGSQRIQEIRTVFTNEGEGPLAGLRSRKHNRTCERRQIIGGGGMGGDITHRGGSQPLRGTGGSSREVEGMVFLLVLRVLLECTSGQLQPRTDEEVMCGHVLGVLWLSAQRDRWLVMTAMSKPARAGTDNSAGVGQWSTVFMAHAASRDWGRLLEARRDMECSSLIMSALGSLEQTGGGLLGRLATGGSGDEWEALARLREGKGDRDSQATSASQMIWRRGSGGGIYHASSARMEAGERGGGGKWRVDTRTSSPPFQIQLFVVVIDERSVCMSGWAGEVGTCVGWRGGEQGLVGNIDITDDLEEACTEAGGEREGAVCTNGRPNAARHLKIEGGQWRWCDARSLRRGKGGSAGGGACWLEFLPVTLPRQLLERGGDMGRRGGRDEMLTPHLRDKGKMRWAD
ncbi:hypothetical protein BDQ17DRAFT_1335515 [Cyathus striatus]|nr:hypothetical protein BDQ17DRAFT_1335515 [Cyathus striatus]